MVPPVLPRLLLCLAVLAPWGRPAAAAAAFSPYGDAKYAAGFDHFDYADPRAPKGGTLRLSAFNGFDSLNPFILRGEPAQGLGLVYETLMVRAQDEPDTVYGLLAQDVEVAADFSTAAFTLRPQARFADGAPVTAADVVFSFSTLRAHGNPSYRQLLSPIESAEATADGKVLFRFARPWRRTGPLAAAALPVLPAKAWAGRDFEAPTLDPPLGSGPYKVEAVSPGRSVAYVRDPGYWGRDLAVNRGRFNFDHVRYDYFRDRDVEFEAFKSGAFDFREEFTARIWATGYTGPAVEKGLIRRESVPDDTPSGIQAFFLNLRLPKFQDPRVRLALNLAFDFDWTNKTMFFGRYRRMASIFENSELAAHSRVAAGEMPLLEPLRGEIPDSVFAQPYAPPAGDGSGDIRDRLRTARLLLAQAGFTMANGRLSDPQGKPFTIDYLDQDGAFARVMDPFFQNLGRLGIGTHYRQVDSAAYKARLDARDFEMISARFALTPTPTDDLVDLWGSAAAADPGSSNLGGVASPAVDGLLKAVLAADTRPDYIDACHALDRVVMAGDYFIPAWYAPARNISWWDRFGRPATAPRYDLGVVDTWWFDPARDAAIAAGQKPPQEP